MGIRNCPIRRSMGLVAALRFVFKRRSIIALLLLLASVYSFRRRALKCRARKKESSSSRGLLDVAAQSGLSLVHHFGYAKDVAESSDELLSKWAAVFKLGCPKLISRETLTCILLISVLISRTLLSVWIASIHGSVVRALVDRNLKSFIFRLIVLLLYSFPASFSNALIEYFEKRLSLQMRERLTWLCSKKYLAGKVFYQMCQVDVRIPHPEHRFTQDIDLWSKYHASLFTSLTKPLLDIIVISRILLRVMGPLGPVVIMSWYALSGVLMRLASPDFANMATTEQKLEAEYRACHTSVVNHSEEIAFYRGNVYEFRILQRTFQRIVSHLKKSMLKRLFVGAYDSLLIKYGAFIVGYGVVGLPIFGPNSESYLGDNPHQTSQITQDYVRHSSLLINLAKAIGRLVASHKQIQSFIGYSSLISNFMDTLDDIQAGHLVTKLTPEMSQISENSNFEERGVLVVSPNIEFRHVPIVTPDGGILINDVNFSVARGQHVFLLGPNGSGKTSLFRILGGLWPLAGGELHRPPSSAIFYIPQRPYMPIGTLRDQLIYPDSISEFSLKGGRDEHLEELLNAVQMEHLLIRYSRRGFDTWRYWQDELSGGEKQRLAIGRLCYHKPVFAILDEATSAVSSDVEGQLYRLCKSRGISLITISHRLSLLKYHDHALKFDGKGHCQFEPISNNRVHVASHSSLVINESPESSHPNRRSQTIGPDDASFASRSASQQFLLLQQSFKP